MQRESDGASIIGRAFTLGQAKPLNQDSSKGPDLAMTESRLLVEVARQLGREIGVEELATRV